MRVLITSGGTTEKIDQVRGITNFASGKLGARLAEKYLSEGHEVTLLAGLHAVIPDPDDNLKIISISDTESLKKAVEDELTKNDVFIHSMAVSDYSPVYMTDLDQAVNQDLKEFLNYKNTEKKISSSADYQVLLLKKNPKIISMIKTINPKIILVGFKLLVDVSKEELFSVAWASLQKNKADFILANDLENITDESHLAYLLDESGGYTQAKNKEEIANLIYNKTKEKYDG